MKEGFTLIENVSINSDFTELPKVEALIDGVCGRLGVTENYGNVLIAVTEAVNNAIIHGNKQKKDAPVRVSVGENDSQFCFSVLDDGNGFDYNELPDPTAPENLEKENGRGIFLMRNLADAVEFADYGKEVTIYFAK